MTSKKAFETIAAFLPYCFGDELKIIARDLEVLDILKKHKPSFFRLSFCDTVSHYNLIYEDGTCPKRTFHHKILNEKEFKLIKEWLKNEEENNI